MLYKKFKKFKWDILTTFQTLWDGIFASSVSIFFVFSEETWLVALFGHFWLKCWSLLSPSFWLWSIRQNGQEFSSTSPLDALFYSTVRSQIKKDIPRVSNNCTCNFNELFSHFSCIWHLPKYRVWLSSQAAFQVHWSCCPRISKYFDLAKKFVNSNELLSFRIWVEP